MLLSLAGSTQSVTPQAQIRTGTPLTTTEAVVLRPGMTARNPPATPVAPAPVSPAVEASRLRLMAQDFDILLQTQALAQREDNLKPIGLMAANEAFRAATRDFDAQAFRNGVVTLRLRSEADARLVQVLYERYQNSRLLGATPEEIEELETRFARLAGWPPLPPVRPDAAQEDSLHQDQGPADNSA